MAHRVDQLLHPLPTSGPVGLTVGGDHPLVDPPSRLDLRVLVDREQATQPLSLLAGEQVGAGVEGPAGGIERVALVAAVAVDGLLDPTPAPVQEGLSAFLCKGLT